MPCGDNAAEILTLCVAMEKLCEMGSLETTSVHVQGHSKIFLRLAPGKDCFMRKPGAGTHYKSGFGKVIANGRDDFLSVSQTPARAAVSPVSD
jgi:hypothetical protein